MDAKSFSKLSKAWFGSQSPDFLTAINSAFDAIGFTESYVTESAAAIKVSPPKRMAIKDSVWGMVDIDPAIRALLDCPIVQRLRQIRQLGLSNLVYPTAEHSRFSHTIGMYAVVNRFVQESQLHQPGPNQQFETVPLSKENAALLKLAAILHDVGHWPYSHALEQAIEGQSDRFTFGSTPLKTFINQRAEIIEGKHLSLSETMSLAIVLSPRFKQFFENSIRPHLYIENTNVVSVESVAALIAGVAPAAELQGLADIVSHTAVDADKIDYIRRDGEACGIPAGIDVGRLFLRSQFIKIKDADILKSFGSPKITRDTLLFVVNASGRDTIDELHHARSSLYRRVYYHHTTLAAEGVLTRCLADAAEPNRSKFANAASLWAHSDDSLIKALAKQATRTETIPHAERIQSRRLPKRSVVIGSAYVEMRFPIADILDVQDRNSLRQQLQIELARGIVDDYQRKALAPKRQIEIEQEIQKESVKIAKIIETKCDNVPSPNIQPYVLFVPIPPPSASPSPTLLLDNNELQSTTVATTSLPQTDALSIQSSNAFVCSDPEWREIVLIATQIVLAKRPTNPRDSTITLKGGTEPNAPDSKLKLTPIVYPAIHLDRGRVANKVSANIARLQDFTVQLSNNGYFDQDPALAPLQSAITIPDRLAKFEGEHGWRVTDRSLAAFISQFPPSLRNEAQALVGKIQVFDRTEIRTVFFKSITKIIASNSRTAILHILPLSRTSGTIIHQLIQQELHSQFPNHLKFHATLGEAISSASQDDPILMCDDNYATGTQATAQLYTWMKTDRPKDFADEKNLLPSLEADANREKLKSLKSHISVISGTEAGKKLIEGHAIKLGLQLSTSFANEVGGSADLTPKMREFLRAVGYSLQKSLRADNQILNEKIEESLRGRALGYGGHCGLSTSYFNVPTSTLTAFWCPGLYNGRPWLPLLIRRGYSQHLKLA
jgi:deoxynucleoside triphosphate triphosphohydrolase SAMHD1